MLQTTIQAALNELIENLERQHAIEDRRGARRYQVHGPLWVKAVGQGGQVERHRAWAHELSIEGASWLMKRALSVDAVVVVDLSSIAGASLALPVNVIHCVEIFEGVYHAGGNFLLDNAMGHPLAG